MRFIFAILLCLLALKVSATDYFVSPDGSDSNNGLTTNTPFRHIYGDVNWGGGNIVFAGDRVIFKGGVRYDGTNANLSLGGFHSGTAGSMIQFIGNYPGFGTGNAIIDGALSYNTAGTNSSGIVGIWPQYCINNVLNIGGNYELITGFTITNFSTYGIVNNLTIGCIISNNIIANSVTTNNVSNMLYNGLTNLLYGNQESAINVGGCTNTVIANNIICFTGQKGINQYAGAAYPESGLMVSGNYIHDCRDDGLNISANSFILIQTNFLANLTNGDNNIGAHSDAAQILQVPLGSTLVFNGNILSNCGGGMFYEPNAANNNAVGTINVTNIYNLVAGQAYQVCTNFSFSPNATPTTMLRYNGTNMGIGTIFTAATGVPNAYWSNANNCGFVKTSIPNGIAICANNLMINVAYTGVDAYDNLNQFWQFNNTFTNVGQPMGPDSRDWQTYITNTYAYNNLSINVFRTVPMIASDGGYYDLSSHVSEHSGFNQFTVDNSFNITPATTSSLASWKTTWGGLETNSFIGAGTFTGNFIPITGVTATGTNMTSILPDISVIPSAQRPNLAADILGVVRPASGNWFPGAFNGTDTNLYVSVTIVKANTVGGQVITNTWYAFNATNTTGTDFNGWTQSGGLLSNSAAPFALYFATNAATFTGNYSATISGNSITVGKITRH